MYDPATLDLLHWCGKWRMALREALGKLQSRQTVAHSAETGQLVESTDRTIAQFTEWISELDAMIDKHSKHG